jgi:hypothetical protein
MPKITLTDTSGIQFDVDVDMIREIKDHKRCRTVQYLYTSGTEDTNVRETVPEILSKIKEVKGL